MWLDLDGKTPPNILTSKIVLIDFGACRERIASKSCR
jgi:hypothetical protein